MYLGGELIYQTSDEYGAIDVVEYFNEIRALHFGSQAQQSANLLCNPYFLIHKYAQAMLLPLCWIKPKRVLVLGLGAGSIVKYLHNYHPDIMIDAVELRPEVIRVASEFFMLPDIDERFRVYCDSAENWLKTHQQHQYDLIIVDVFLASTAGKDITVDLSIALHQLNERLSDTGVAVFNHLGNNVRSYPGFQQLSKIFKKPLYNLNIPQTNVIIYASRERIPGSISVDTLSQLGQISNLPYKMHFERIQPVSSTLQAESGGFTL